MSKKWRIVFMKTISNIFQFKTVFFFLFLDFHNFFYLEKIENKYLWTITTNEYILVITTFVAKFSLRIYNHSHVLLFFQITQNLSLFILFSLKSKAFHHSSLKVIFSHYNSIFLQFFSLCQIHFCVNYS